jgi:hypothetical protein
MCDLLSKGECEGIGSVGSEGHKRHLHCSWSDTLSDQQRGHDPGRTRMGCHSHANTEIDCMPALTGTTATHGHTRVPKGTVRGRCLPMCPASIAHAHQRQEPLNQATSLHTPPASSERDRGTRDACTDRQHTDLTLCNDCWGGAAHAVRGWVGEEGRHHDGVTPPRFIRKAK